MHHDTLHSHIVYAVMRFLQGLETRGLMWYMRYLHWICDAERCQAINKWGQTLRWAVADQGRVLQDHLHMQ